MPAPPANGSAERSDAQRRGRTREHGAGEQDECERTGRPAPVEVPVAHHARREQTEEYAEGGVDGRSHQPLHEVFQRGQRVWFLVESCFVRWGHGVPPFTVERPARAERGG